METKREREAKKRAANVAKGLTAKGKPRKARYKPKPEQSVTIFKTRSTMTSPKPHSTPLNIIKRPPKLPPMTPVTDEDREEA